MASETREAVARAQERRLRREAKGRWARFVGLALLVLALDQVAKAIVRGTLEAGEHVRVFAGFFISRVRNEGIAFGLFPGRQGVIALLTVVALASIGIALSGLARRHRAVTVGGGLLMGGSLSNLIDRLAHGGVTDYLDPVHWPAFNLADVGIVVGAALIVLGLLAAEQGGEAGG